MILGHYPTFSQIPDDKAICNGYGTTKTAAEWAAEYGRGHLLSCYG